jgi:hypothetical protein
VAPVFFDPHVCSPPPTADLIGREMDFECRCGRRWRLEHHFEKQGFPIAPSVAGMSWAVSSDYSDFSSTTGTMR